MKLEGVASSRYRQNPFSLQGYLPADVSTAVGVGGCYKPARGRSFVSKAGGSFGTLGRKRLISTHFDRKIRKSAPFLGYTVEEESYLPLLLIQSIKGNRERGWRVSSFLAGLWRRVSLIWMFSLTSAHHKIPHLGLIGGPPRPYPICEMPLHCASPKSIIASEHSFLWGIPRSSVSLRQEGSVPILWRKKLRLREGIRLMGLEPGLLNLARVPLSHSCPFPFTMGRCPPRPHLNFPVLSHPI